jgi:hypothetical protein
VLVVGAHGSAWVSWKDQRGGQLLLVQWVRSMVINRVYRGELRFVNIEIDTHVKLRTLKLPFAPIEVTKFCAIVLETGV